MAVKQKPPEKYKSVKPAPAPAKAAEPEPVQAVAAEEPIAVDSSSKEEAVVIASALAVIAPSPGSSGGERETNVEFDINALPLKTLEFLNDNAAAMFDYAAELSKATSMTEVIELQSRFTKERYSTLIKQINEAAEVTRQLALGAGFSVRHSFGSFAA
jgi:hypothetical protein